MNGTAGPAADVFISYSHKDGDLVRRLLIPRLKDAGVNVLYDADLARGVLVDVLDRAIKEARYVVIILSQAWLESRWGQFEAAAAILRDRGRGEVIITLRISDFDDSEVLEPLRRVLWNDCRDDPEMKQGAGFVIQAVERYRREASLTAGDPLADAFRRLARYVSAEAASDLRVAEKVFEYQRPHLVLLAAYKRVHDQLQELELQCYAPILEIVDAYENASKLGEVAIDPLLLEIPRMYVDRLADVVRELAGISELRSKLYFVEEALIKAHVRLSTAASGEFTLVKEALRLISRVIDQNISKFNQWLVSEAVYVDVNKLIDAIEKALADALRGGLPPTDGDAIDAVLKQMKQSHETLDTLIATHASWQLADGDLRRINSSLNSGMEELVDSWDDVHKKVSALTVADPSWQYLQTTGARIQVAIDQNKTTMMKNLFLEYRSAAMKRFYQVDLMLKDNCDQLCPRDPASAALIGQV